METELALSKMFNNVWPHLGERERRLVAASEARRIGRKGISMVSRACGLSRVTITKGIKELDEAPLAPGKIRRSGAGRPRVERVDPEIWNSLDSIMKESSEFDRNPALLWTVKSTRRIAHELTAAQHRISHEKVAQILRQNGYNLQGTRRNDDNRLQPNRRAQFQHIDTRVIDRLEEGQPVLAIETKRRESAFITPISGNRPLFDRLVTGEYPTGIYDPQLCRDTVNVETALDPAAFTCDSILGWWLVEGKDIYSDASCLFVTADACATSHKTQWQTQIQKLSNAIGIPVEFCRFPPGTSKWNLSHQRLFSFVSSHWQGETERDYEISARLINPPSEVRTMALGLRLDHSRFQPVESSAQEQDIFLLPSEFHGDWNFTVKPESFGSYPIKNNFNNPRQATISM
jgi:hypothetical protein